MTWHEIFNKLPRDDRREMTYLFIRRIHSPARKWLRELRPVDMAFPAVFSQIAFFAFVLYKPMENFIGILITGNLFITALALLPSIWARSTPRVHWIR